MSWLSPSLPFTDQIRKPVVWFVLGIWRLSLMVIASVRGLVELMVSLLPLTETEAPPLVVTVYLESTLLVSVSVTVYLPLT